MHRAKNRCVDPEAPPAATALCLRHGIPNTLSPVSWMYLGSVNFSLAVVKIRDILAMTAPANPGLELALSVDREPVAAFAGVPRGKIASDVA